VNAHDVFVAHQDFIERALKVVCARQRLSAPESEDFCSAFRLRLMEDDCAVFTKFQGRSSVQTYLVSVVMHFFQDWRNARWGKWRPSAEARRLGPIAVELETLCVRDEVGFENACEMLCARYQGSLSRADVETIAARLPPRQKRAFVSDGEIVNLPSALTSPDAQYFAREAGVEARRATAAMCAAFDELAVQDRLIVRMLVEDGLSVATISRTLKLRQKPLYRRIHQVLASLRARLEHQGFSAQHVADLLRHGGFETSGDAGDGKISEPVRLFSRNPGTQDEQHVQNTQNKQNGQDGRNTRNTKRLAR
jgi:RNA polymerase sigma factor (sigma-70 family)